MPSYVPPDAQVKQLLATSKTIAVVGLSDNPARPSNDVALYLKGVGYEVIPINPSLPSIWGITSYPSLKAARDAGKRIDLVDVFRDPAHVVPIAQEAVAVGAKGIWFQLGVINEEAAALAQKAGLTVVMDRCSKIEHRRLLG